MTLEEYSSNRMRSGLFQSERMMLRKRFRNKVVFLINLVSLGNYLTK